MKRRNLLLASVLGLSLGLGAIAWAQSIVQDNLSGNEAWNAGQGPGGPTVGFITSNLLRNSVAKVTNAVTGTYGSGALASLSEGGLVLFTTQPLAAVALTLPPNPVTDGARAGFCNVTPSNFATTAISFASSTGQTLSAISITALTATSCVEVIFNRANTTWYRTR